MNLFALLMLFLVGAAAVFGLILIGSGHQQAIVDTYGNTSSAATNASQGIVSNLSATGEQVGGGAVLLVVGVIGAVLFLAFIALARK